MKGDTMFNHHNPSGQSSELEVVGKGSVGIRLRSEPREIKVRFVDEGTYPIPCNPQHADTLSWQVDRQKTRHGHNLVLNIHWVVLGARTIEWDILY